jgi:hypothetical protein
MANKKEKSILNHRKEIIKRIRNNQIKNNYSSEKTKKQKSIRYIKRRTRIIYPLLKCLKCNYCKNPATEHHHYTNPITIDKFKYVCHPCHIKHDNQISIKTL